jgi:hypothetical protein
VGYSEPGQHPRISEQEKNYIESSLQAKPQDIQVMYKIQVSVNNFKIVKKHHLLGKK